MKKFNNGEYEEMTAEEIAEMQQLTTHQLFKTYENDALALMATAMSTANTLAQVRDAAKLFLTATEVAKT